MPFRRIRSAIVCMVKVLPAPEHPRIQMLEFLYCLESKISAMTRELLCLFTPSRIPLSSQIWIYVLNTHNCTYKSSFFGCQPIVGYKKSTTKRVLKKNENYKHCYCSMGKFSIQSQMRANRLPSCVILILPGRICLKSLWFPLL